MNWTGLKTIAAVIAIGTIKGLVRGSVNILHPEGPEKEKAEIKKINREFSKGEIEGLEINADTLSAVEILADKSIQSIITSPPYFNIIKYTGDEREIGQENSLRSYLESLTYLFVSLLPKLKDDGTLCINISDTKTHQVIPALLAKLLENNGYKLQENITWVKANPIPTGARRIQRTTESILCFSKKGHKAKTNVLLVPKKTQETKRFYPRKRRTIGINIERFERHTANERTHKVMGDSWILQNTDQKRLDNSSIQQLFNRFSETGDIFAQNMWGVGKVDILGMKHPAPMNTRVIQRLVAMTTNKGDVVYDPFSGTGAVTKTAKLCGRIGIGCELNPIWSRMAVIASTVRNPGADYAVLDETAVNPQTGRGIIEPLKGAEKCSTTYDPSKTAFIDLISRRISRRNIVIDTSILDTEIKI